MKAWIKYVLLGGILIVAALIVLPTLLTSHRLNAALRANEQLRTELDTARGELAKGRIALASAEAENRALGASLEDSREQLRGIREAIDSSQIITSELGDTNQDLIELIRSCLQLVAEVRQAVGGS